MRIDDRVRGTREWQRARELLVGEFHDDEDRENPAVEIAAPQMRQRAGRHHAVQRAGRTDVPVDFGIEEPQPGAHRQRGDRNR